MSILPRWLQQSQYTTVSMTSHEDDIPDKDEHVPPAPHPDAKRAKSLSVGMLPLLVALATVAVAAFLLGVLISPKLREGSSNGLPNTVPRGSQSPRCASPPLPFTSEPGTFELQLTLIPILSSVDEPDDGDVSPQRQLRRPTA